MSLKIAVGMSGGIDSSIAAFLLKKQGHDVTGITLKLWDNASRCCDLKDISNVQEFSHKIGIPHYVIDLRKEFRQSIINYFIKEYLNGRTPNPCVVCNKEIKFAHLYSKLKILNFDFIATGHYAKIIKKNNNFFLSKAKDRKKSQEYFLARLNKNILGKMIFPLQDITKNEVRKIADTIDFDFRKEESQEVCFINPGESYYKFILQNIDSKKNFSGNIIDQENKILGHCDFYFKYTIGQRRKLGISDRTPYYVINIDVKNKNVIVGKKKDTYKAAFGVKNVYWYGLKKESFKVKIRYNHKESDAEMQYKNGNRIIKFSKLQHAITPGQLAVFYDKELVIGSAWIDKVI